MKRFAILLLAATMTLALAAGSFAVPTAVIKTIGISARDVALNPDDIYTKASTGLPNVGVGEMVYLKGTAGEEQVITWAWELTARPNGSNAALNANDAEVVFLVPDVVGTYRASLTVTSDSGQSEPATIAINSANYVGVGGIVGNLQVGQCAMCHDADETDKVARWSQTKHARKFSDHYNGVYGGRYRESCIRCHTVGYDTTAGAANQGFDDMARQENWVFIDSAHGGIREGAWDEMRQNFPLTASKANIQCENCHGPGSAHRSNIADNRIAVTWDVGVCAKCHDSGNSHFRPMQWKLSGHSNPPVEERSACSGCHSGYGFVDRIEGLPPLERDSTYLPIGCVTCHDPHDATNPYQLRTVAPVTLLDSTVIDIGNGNICANCHQSRRKAATYVDGRITNPARFNPHGSPQADMLIGTNAIEFEGAEIERSPHASVVDNGCVGCHMAETPRDTGNHETFLQLGDHTFAMKTEAGAEHVEACTECHAGLESFASKMADSDWDGDGTTEGVRAEIAGMMNTLAMMLPPVGEPTITPANWFTGAQRRAAYNYFFVLNDKSGGMHNARYARSILTASMQQDLGVEKTEEVPASYSLSEAYPNPFNPVATFNYSLTRDGDVRVKVFDMAGREVQTIVSGDQKAGSYRAAINMTGRPSGLYLLRMQAGSFDASRKLVLVK